MMNSQRLSYGVKLPTFRFAAIALGLCILWFVVYDLWILKDGTLDEIVSMHVATVAGGILSIVGLEPLVAGRTVMLPGALGIYVADGCNGISSLGLFAGFVLAYPGKWKQRLWFIPSGIFIVYAVNVLRVVVLAWVQQSAPALFDDLHGFASTTIFYVVVFILWVLWAKISDNHVSINPARRLGTA